MPREKYTTVKIPEELTNVLDRFRKAWGYSSRAEMVDDAVRQLIVRMKRLDPGEVRQVPAPVPRDEGR
jgi:metal-responsive CopG/Arc/MetJ family transcriptional regulator